ncbi:MAG: glucose-6-phosphate dehydrogenase [Verrucomicrobia bacterium]|nr:glucose-6-phosphate dehydrogenase [Verrucomicrobiota bacterium]
MMSTQHTQEASPAPEARTPLPRVSAEAPFTAVIFGASGDLTRRKLVPGLYALYRDGFLPDRFTIVGVARRELDDQAFRNQMAEAIREHSRIEVTEDTLATFLGRIRYHVSHLDEPESYRALNEKLNDTSVYPANRLFFLAVKPELMSPVVQGLETGSLLYPIRDARWSRVVVEKPFGRDLASAVALNRRLLARLDESQVYRIDHYLGKETVQNMLSFRFANTIFEPLFNQHFVDHVQITVSETVGMESGRGGYFDDSGVVRDMVQNHLLQLLCLVGMEPPSELTARSIHDQKVQLLRSVVPFTPDRIVRDAVRGQYQSGLLDGEPVPGYREEDRVDPDSDTAAYCALRMEIGNWRWSGVPFYLRTGKRLARRVSEIAVQFKTPPLQLFQTVECDGDVCDLTRAKPNVLVFRLQPDEGISLQVSAKRPAMQLMVENVRMHFGYQDTWHKSLPEAYERLLLDVMRGDATLFTRSDEVEAMWSIVDPILHAWEGHRKAYPIAGYAPGSWGPAEADALLQRDGRAWRNPGAPG